MSIESMKSEALNEFARSLAQATTIEEARGLALVMMRQMLDLVYPSATSSPVTIELLNDQYREVMADEAAAYHP